MGCKATTNKSFNIEEEYKRQNLPMPDPSICQNDFEKEAFMTINLIRMDPLLMIPKIKAFKCNKNYRG